MPKAVGGLWRAVERTLGHRIPNSEAVRNYLVLEGQVEHWLNSDGEDKKAEFDSIVQTIRNLQASGLIEGHSDNEIIPNLAWDDRWDIIARLHGEPHFSPIRIVAPPLMVISAPGSAPRVPEMPRIRIELDGRIALNTLIQELRKAWPQMIRRGWIRRSRPLGERKIALILFICQQADPDWSWSERCERWNAQYPEWTYGSGPAMASDFRRAEESLTGKRFGLAAFYDPFWNASLPELKRAVDAGDRRARETLIRYIKSLPPLDEEQPVID